MKRLLSIICAAMGIAAFGEETAEKAIPDIAGSTGMIVESVGTDYVLSFTDPNTAGVLSIEQGGVVDILIVGGGGEGGFYGAGGGAGGVIYKQSYYLEAGEYAVTVGKGGDGTAELYIGGASGGNSQFGEFSDLLAYGGGGGGSFDHNQQNGSTGKSGGSGGGSGIYNSTNAAGVEGQGHQGGSGQKGVVSATSTDNYLAGGGGGAGEAGADADYRISTAGKGGDGIVCSITGRDVTYGGGGGAGAIQNWTGAGWRSGAGGAGGGGHGVDMVWTGVEWAHVEGYGPTDEAVNGVDGLGGGGGGGSGGPGAPQTTGGRGGNGIVIVRLANPSIDIYTPTAEFGAEADGTHFAAHVNATITSLGEGAESWTLLAKVAFAGDTVTNDVAIAEGVDLGTVKASVTNLLPGRNYIVAFEVVNNLGKSIDYAPFAVTTAAYDPENIEAVAAREAHADEPVIGDVVTVSDTELGDTATVAFTITETDGVVATVETSRTGDFSDAEGWETTRIGDGAYTCTMYSDNTESSRYIQPGATTYYRVRTVDTAGGRDLLPVGRFTTKAGAEIGSVTMANNLWDITWTVTFAERGVGETTLKLYAGTDASELALVNTVFVSEGMTGVLTWTCAELGVPVYYRVVAENGCSTANWSTETEEGLSYTPVDQTTYTWIGGESGKWSEKANWQTASDDERITMPNSPACIVVIPSEAGDVTITVDGAYAAANLSIANSDTPRTVTFTSADKTATALTLGMISFGANTTLMLKDVAIGVVNPFTISSGCALKLDAASLIGETYAEAYAATLTLENDSLLYLKGSWPYAGTYPSLMIGNTCYVLIDNSQIRLGADLVSCHGTGGTPVYEFRGTRAQMLVERVAQMGESSWATGGACRDRLVFHVPAEEYERIPFVTYNYIFGWGGYADVVIAADSPVYKASAEKRIFLQAYGGIHRLEDLTTVMCETTKRANRTTFGYCQNDGTEISAEAIAGGADPQNLYLTVTRPAGLYIIIK